MANKKYNEFTPGIYDTAKIFLQADDVTGALEKINLPLVPDGSLLVPYNGATSDVNIGSFVLRTSKISSNNSIEFRPDNGRTYLIGQGMDNRFYAYDYTSSYPYPYLELSAHSLNLNVGGNTSRGLVRFSDSGNSYFTGGNLGAGITNPTAVLHLKAGTASPGKAPLKFTAGALLTAIEAGAMEWDGTNLYISQTGVRKQLAYEPAANQKFGDGDTIATSQRFFDCDNFPFILSADSNISETGFYINYTSIPKTLYLLSDGGSGVKSSVFLNTTSIAMQTISSSSDTNIEMLDSSINIFANAGANSNRLTIEASQIKILKNNAALAAYADNAAAITAGLTVGALYRTTDFLKQVH